MCIVDNVRIQKDCHTTFVRLKLRVASVKISSNDGSLTSNHFKFHFLSKIYSLASDDVCNLSATRTFVRTNGEDVKNIKPANSYTDDIIILFNFIFTGLHGARF